MSRAIRRDYAEIGQDKWVLETMFPGVRNGYFVDLGSGHGTIGSNTKALEEVGWTGTCIDPFPVHMEGLSCRVFEEVVFSEAGRQMGFRVAGGLAGLDETLGCWGRGGITTGGTSASSVTTTPSSG